MANNPYVNKVVFGGVAIVDITPTTAVESDVASGKVFFKADGSQATGSHVDSAGGRITQDANGYIHLSETGDIVAEVPLSVNANGTYTPNSGYAYSSVNVNVQPTTESKEVTPSEQTQVVTPTNADALSSVTVNPIPSSYIQPNGTVNITANGTVDVAQYASANVNVSGGGGVASVDESDVNFYDYDGTCVAAYTAAEFANLAALPDNPSHDGLTAQGWNWTLADAKTYVAAHGFLDIGQCYMPNDEKTHINIRLNDGRLSPTLGLAINGTATVEWGDGTTSTVTGSSTSTIVNTQHTYPSKGVYEIKIAVTGSLVILGSNTYLCQLLWSNSTTANINAVYRCAIESVFIGKNVTQLGTSAFNGCTNLVSATVPKTLTNSIQGRVFYNCIYLKGFTVPSGVTGFNNGAFYACRTCKFISTPKSVTNIATSTINTSGVFRYACPTITTIYSSDFNGCVSLQRIAIPTGVTAIQNDSFNGCLMLSTVTIPNTVTSIAANAFNNCLGLAEIHFKGNTPPTLAAATAFLATRAAMPNATTQYSASSIIYSSHMGSFSSTIL